MDKGHCIDYRLLYRLEQVGTSVYIALDRWDMIRVWLKEGTRKLARNDLRHVGHVVRASEWEEKVTFRLSARSLSRPPGLPVCQRTSQHSVDSHVPDCDYYNERAQGKIRREKDTRRQRPEEIGVCSSSHMGRVRRWVAVPEVRTEDGWRRDPLPAPGTIPECQMESRCCTATTLLVQMA